MRKTIVFTLAALAVAAASHAVAQQSPSPNVPTNNPAQMRAREQRQREMFDRSWEANIRSRSTETQRDERLGSRAGSAAYEIERRRRRAEEDRRTQDARDAEVARAAADRSARRWPWSAAPWSVSPWDANPWSEEPWRRGGGGGGLPAISALEMPSPGPGVPPLPDLSALRASANAGGPAADRDRPPRRR